MWVSIWKHRPLSPCPRVLIVQLPVASFSFTAPFIASGISRFLKFSIVYFSATPRGFLKNSPSSFSPLPRYRNTGSRGSFSSFEIQGESSVVFFSRLSMCRPRFPLRTSMSFLNRKSGIFNLLWLAISGDVIFLGGCLLRHSEVFGEKIRFRNTKFQTLYLNHSMDLLRWRALWSVIKHFREIKYMLFCNKIQFCFLHEEINFRFWKR